MKAKKTKKTDIKRAAETAFNEPAQSNGTQEEKVAKKTRTVKKKDSDLISKPGFPETKPLKKSSKKDACPGLSAVKQKPEVVKKPGVTRKGTAQKPPKRISLIKPETPVKRRKVAVSPSVTSQTVKSEPLPSAPAEIESQVIVPEPAEIESQVTVPEKPEVQVLPEPPVKAVEVKPETKLTKLRVSTQVSVRELSEKMGIRVTDFIKKLMGMGVFATINQRLDPDVAELIAMEYGFDLEFIPLYGEEESKSKEIAIEKPENLKPRPPVVTIMGHVDHGKTTLLDALRQSNIVDEEAGQITQHIGAYIVETPKGPITFLDTPGHEAFTAMRAHGADVTDIVILVVSAVDGVMPQTIEAISHARAGNVPIIVAINKIDLPTANVQKVKQELSNHGLVPEEWGGKTIIVEISAKKKTNLDKLLDMIALQAEIMELKANPDGPGQGVVIEAKLDAKRGHIVTVLTTRGTINVGDAFVVGTAYGKVRALISDRGTRLNSIKPGIPAEVLGMSGSLPQAGDVFRVIESEREARYISEKRRQLKREDTFIHQKQVSLLSLKSQVEQKLLKTLNIILKTDVYGSLQAIRDSLEKLSTKEVAIHILHSGVGNVNESDVVLAKASNAIIFGFNVEPDSKVIDNARNAGVEVRVYKVIYDLFEDVKAAINGLFEPEIVETITGRAEIKQIFDLSSGRVAGCFVREGRISRNQSIRVVRGKEIIFKGKISSLRRMKEDVKEVEKNLECGIMLEGFKEFAVGDFIEAITREEKIRRLTEEK